MELFKLKVEQREDGLYEYEVRVGHRLFDIGGSLASVEECIAAAKVVIDKYEADEAFCKWASNKEEQI